MWHTLISLLPQSGASPAYAQKQAGHKSRDLTISAYRHSMPGRNRAVVDVLGSPEEEATRKTQSLEKSARLW